MASPRRCIENVDKKENKTTTAALIKLNLESVYAEVPCLGRKEFTSPVRCFPLSILFYTPFCTHEALCSLVNCPGRGKRR